MTEEEYNSLRLGDRVRNRSYDALGTIAGRDDDMDWCVLMDEAHEHFHDCRGLTPRHRGRWLLNIGKWDLVTLSLRDRVNALWDEVHATT